MKNVAAIPGIYYVARLIAYTYRTDPKKVSLALLIITSGCVFEVSGIMLLLPLLDSVGLHANSGISAQLSAKVVGVFVQLGWNTHTQQGVLLVLFIFVATLRSFLRRTQSLIIPDIATAVALKLSHETYSCVIRGQWHFLVRRRANEFTFALTSELRRTEDAVTLILTIFSMAVQLLLYVGLAFRISAEITTIVLITGILLILALRKSIGSTLDAGQNLSISMSEVYSTSEEHLQNLKIVKMYGAEDRDIQKFMELCRNVAADTLHHAHTQAKSGFLYELGALGAMMIIVYVAFVFINLEPPTIFIIFVIFSRLTPQFTGLYAKVEQCAHNLPAFNRILHLEALCRANADDAVSNTCRFTFQKSLKLENVKFSYDTDARQPHPTMALKGILMEIRANQTTAIVGPSGSGKSTIADIIAGLLRPSQGMILLDEQLLTPEMSRGWRTQVGYVGQETVLFHGTIRSNLLWANPQATEDEMRSALELASAHFVTELPDGLDHHVGDRGVLLSSGQRQRIAVARALVRKPSLLILDEATNALDVDNERQILRAINELHGTLTVLLITHRASTIRFADYIYEVSRGMVSQHGRSESLHLVNG
jgi:ATP-binding cassette subfamily C protein